MFMIGIKSNLSGSLWGASIGIRMLQKHWIPQVASHERLVGALCHVESDLECQVVVVPFIIPCGKFNIAIENGHL